MRYIRNSSQDFLPGSRVNLDKVYWKSVLQDYAKCIVTKMPPTFANCDGGLYVGCAGVAYAFYYLSELPVFSEEERASFLTTAEQYIEVSLSYSASKNMKDPPAGFLIGAAGPLAVGSLIYKKTGRLDSSKELYQQYNALSTLVQPLSYLPGGSDELLVGRAGYLCGAKLLNRHIKEAISKDSINKVCKSVVESGRKYSQRNQSRTPLMYSYYDAEYLGAAHGLSGILQMLLSFPEFLASDVSAENDIHQCVEFMMSLLQPNGNIVPALGEPPRPSELELVHWCHGAPGVVYLLARAYLKWKDDKYLQACLRCGELTWQCGLLKKGPGICHGVAGSGYVFLLLYRLTSDELHYHRAVKFAEFIMSSEFEQCLLKPDSPFSLFEGIAGTLCFFADLLYPLKAEFPFFDIFT